MKKKKNITQIVAVFGLLGILLSIVGTGLIFIFTNSQPQAPVFDFQSVIQDPVSEDIAWEELPVEEEVVEDIDEEVSQ